MQKEKSIMVRKQKHTMPVHVAQAQAEAAQVRPEIETLLEKVKDLLAAGNPKGAMEQIRRSRLTSPEVANATGLCLLRLGEAARAVDVLRGLVLSGVLFRPDAPAACKINFAAAMLLTNNLGGCLAALHDVNDEQHPAVQRLRAAIARWKASLSLIDRLRLFMGGGPAVVIDDAMLGTM